MTVRYIRVKPLIDLFAPAVRAFGNIAVVGASTDDQIDVNVPVAFSAPDQARTRLPGELGEAIALAFAQSPGPTLVYGVRVNSDQPDWDDALDVVATLNVQLVMLAGVSLDETTGAPGGSIATLVAHVDSVSSTGGDGLERMGVVMLPKGIAALPQTPDAPGPITGALASDRMVYIAHQSDQDAAAAVAGTIAGYPPHISLLLKQVKIDSPSFSASDIDNINGVETFDSGPTGKGINWLTSPSLIPGHGVYLGEGYTGGSGPGQKKFIDVTRTVDDVSFRLKAQLIKTIGNLRISRSGLRALIAQMEAILDPLVVAEVLDSFQIVVPLLALLDKDPATLTATEEQEIKNARDNRLVQILAVVEYAGAVHRIAITLKFE
jgi:hypothetical protein